MGRRRRDPEGAPGTPGRPSMRPEPDAVLDFHGRGPGLEPRTVRAELLAFLAEARRRGFTRLRVVTGRGLHSRGPQVVRPQVERTLREAEREGAIRCFTTERLDAGGSGAFRVDL